MKKKILGNFEKPRISIFRSNKQIYVQVIDDVLGNTVTSFSSKKIEDIDKKMTKIKQSYKVGLILGLKLKKLKIKKLVLDKKNYLYHGRIKSLADGIRSVGIKF
ncbi:50S ribosomal protein L18 [Blattabacterium cuenoti]|uniref:50S ribosomal protein L18 n=1 Tax=Blattabacterium cuenoti TaxID=1653831 RepID=UPI00163BEBA7|nr:50S ribosomal protein L18 [Blattabacterium cuenoti]